MSKKAFDKIAAGLEEALVYVRKIEPIENRNPDDVLTFRHITRAELAERYPAAPPVGEVLPVVAVKS